MNYSKLSDAALEQLASGNIDYTTLLDSDLKEIIKAESYGSPMQQAVAGAEAAARGATMGLSTGIEVMAGVPAEDIRAREQANPATALAGETVGVVGSGVAGGIAKVGGAILRRTAASAVERAAASAAVQGALYQGGKEVHKLLAEDPEQSFGTAMTNIGMSAALMGGLGVTGSVATQLGSKVLDKAASLVQKAKLGEKIQGLEVNPQAVADWAVDFVPVGGFGRKILREAATRLPEEFPEAVQGAINKALKSAAGVDRQALSQAAAYAKELVAGDKLLGASVRAVFNEGALQALPDSKIPGPEARSRLENVIRDMALDPLRHAEESSARMGAYLDEESGALGMAMARAASYLQSIKPVEAKLGPLDPPAPISKDQTAKYQRALSIAEQPLLVLQHIKQGSLTADDVVTLESVHPATSALLKQRLMNQLVEHSATGQKLPYKIAMSLSLLFGTPLEASLSPQNIVGNQSIGVPPKPEEVRQNTIVNAQQGKSLQDLPKAAATGAQSREATRQMRK